VKEKTAKRYRHRSTIREGRNGAVFPPRRHSRKKKAGSRKTQQAYHVLGRGSVRREEIYVGQVYRQEAAGSYGIGKAEGSCTAAPTRSSTVSLQHRIHNT
jgi:hypothetical protein